MTTQITPDPVLHFVDSNGNALVGGLLFTYAAGTTTKQTTYTDETGATPNANPIVLNARGECTVWFTTGQNYKLVLSPAGDTDPPTNPIWTVDNLSAVAPVSAAMTPVVAASTLAAARTALGLGSMALQNANAVAITGGVITGTSPVRVISAAHTVVAADNGYVLSLEGGAFYTVTFPGGGTVDPDFRCRIINNESTTIGKGIASLGPWTWTIYPGQSYDILNIDNVLTVLDGNFIGSGTGKAPPRRWRTTSLNVYVDGGVGSDDPTVADGLAVGARAFKTITQAFYAMKQNFDHGGSFPVINIANGTYNESIFLSGTPVGAPVIFVNGASALGVTWQPAGISTAYCLVVGDGAIIEYSNIQWNGGGLSAATALQIHQTGICDQNAGVGFGGFGNVSGIHVDSNGAGGTYNINASYAVNNAGGADFHINMAGMIQFNQFGGTTVTITNAPNIQVWFRCYGGIISCASAITWTGSLLAGGQQWIVGPAGWLQLNGNTGVPGSVAGSPTTGSAPTGALGWATA